MDILTAIARSNRAMIETVWPVMGPMCGGGRLEAVTGRTGEQLDRDTGFDMTWSLGRLRYSVATRVQWPDRSYDTFTIRTRTRTGSRNTELRKRMEAVAAGALFPQRTIQAYVTPGGEFLAAAMYDTAALYRWVIGYLAAGGSLPEIQNKDDLSMFVKVYWSALDRDQIIIVKAPRALPTTDQMSLWDEVAS